MSLDDRRSQRSLFVLEKASPGGRLADAYHQGVIQYLFQPFVVEEVFRAGVDGRSWFRTGIPEEARRESGGFVHDGAAGLGSSEQGEDQVVGDHSSGATGEDRLSEALGSVVQVGVGVRFDPARSHVEVFGVDYFGFWSYGILRRADVRHAVPQD